MERSDPRGSFIRMQLVLHGLPTNDPRRERLQLEVDELLRVHKKTWVGRFRGARITYGVEGGRTWVKGNPTSWTFERGFVHTVKMCAEDFLPNAELLLQEEPVERVQLTQASKRLSRFVDQAANLERVRGLGVHRQTLSDSDLDALFRSERLAGLVDLDLQLSKIGVRRGKRVFSEGVVLRPRLRRLNLHGCKLGDGGMRAPSDDDRAR